VSARQRRERLLRRCYPAAWRERYGEDLLEYLDDSYGDSRLPLRAALSLARSGTWQRCREVGLVGDATAPDVRLRAGALSVLGAWMIFVVAGSIFAKYSEHWDAVTPAASRALPSTAMTVMQGAAFAGATLCVVAGLMTSRSFWRWARPLGVRGTLRQVRPALLAGFVATSTSAVVIEVAHHLSSSQRNGGVAWYQVVGLAWMFTLVGCLITGYACVARIVMRLDYSEREMVVLSRLAAGVASLMVVVLASLIVWWVAIARVANSFLTTGFMGVSANSIPLPMVTVALTMAVGLFIAGWGVRRTFVPWTGS